MTLCPHLVVKQKSVSRDAPKSRTNLFDLCFLLAATSEPTGNKAAGCRPSCPGSPAWAPPQRTRSPRGLRNGDTSLQASLGRPSCPILSTNPLPQLGQLRVYATPTLIPAVSPKSSQQRPVGPLPRTQDRGHRGGRTTNGSCVKVPASSTQSRRVQVMNPTLSPRTQGRAPGDQRQEGTAPVKWGVRASAYRAGRSGSQVTGGHQDPAASTNPGLDPHSPPALPVPLRTPPSPWQAFGVWEQDRRERREV